MSAADAQLAVLVEAIEVERKGILFYTEAADKASSPKARDVLLGLADDERYHEKVLEEQRGAIQSSGGFDVAAAEQAAAYAENRPRPSIIPTGEGKEQAIARASNDELRALDVGMETERRSFEFYRKAADEVQEPAIKRLYQSLAQWENTHFEALQEMHDFLADPEGWFLHQERPIMEG